MNKTGRNNIIDKLNSLSANNKLPLQVIDAGQELYRVQSKGHTEGFHYHIPSDNLGRFNDPDAKLGVCYVATQPEVALGEVFLREGHTELDKSDLGKWDIAQLKTKQSLSVLDIGQLMPKLGLKLEEVAGPSYENCQEIVRFLSQNPNPDVHGIKYTSRHLAKECFAMFTPPPGAAHLETDKITNLSDFKCKATGLDTEEILTDVLGVDVTDLVA